MTKGTEKTVTLPKKVLVAALTEIRKIRKTLEEKTISH